jgi:hypothetical protein
MRRALCTVAVVLLSGCSTFGTGGIGDRYADERSEFVSDELALRRFPPGAIGVTAVPANSLSNDGPFATSSTVGSETGFYVADSVTSDDLTDFYVDLLARTLWSTRSTAVQHFYGELVGAGRTSWYCPDWQVGSGLPI